MAEGHRPASRRRFWRPCRKAVEAANDDGDFVRLDAAAFAASPADSIDYAVMEKLPAATDLGIPGRVVPLDVGWSDVGAWDALWQAIARDADGNAVKGDVWLEDSHGNLVIAEHGLVACIGCEDMVVVETADAVLIAPKARTQEVKRIVSRLKAAGRSEVDLHRKVHRPWGWYDSIDSGERFQVKRIVVRPGATLSLQMHHHRAEHWVVVRGTAKVTRGEETHPARRERIDLHPAGRQAPPGKSRARCRSRSSRCSRAAISARTTSCALKTTTAGNC